MSGWFKYWHGPSHSEAMMPGGHWFDLALMLVLIAMIPKNDAGPARGTEATSTSLSTPGTRRHDER
eukprot:1007119-Rhodomonas_salina.2